MPRFPYNYTSFNVPPSPAFPGGQILYRPFLLATLKAPNGKIYRSLTWPDSGADQCIIPLSGATFLNLEDKTPTHRRRRRYEHDLPHTVKVDFGNGLRFESYVGCFPEGLEAQGWGLLGQSGFFENFLVTFDYASRRFWLESR